MMDQVLALLEKNEVPGYQVTDNVISKNVKGAPRFNTPVWPGYNVIITIQINNDDKASGLIEQLRAFNRDTSGAEDELLTVCSWGMETFITE
jgi:hypothetical protein